MNPPSPWRRLLPCVIAIMAVANLQYTWTLFAKPIMGDLGVKLSAVQLAFTLYIIAQTWLAPFEGSLADRFAPRPLAALGGLLVGLNWIGAGLARSLGVLYASCLLGGFGCGLVMSVGGRIAVRSFPGRRGLAVGVVSVAYGLGPVLAVLPIQHAIARDGYRRAFIIWGVIQALIVLAAAVFMIEPGPEDAPASTRTPASSQNLPPLGVLRTGRFWLMYLIMTLVAFGGLLITAQLAPIAESFGVTRDTLVLGTGAITLAILVDRLLNAAARPFWGSLSDRFGRAETMALAFTCEALAILLLIRTAHDPLWFVVASGLSFFAWGEIFSLFPAMIADVFGTKHAMANYGLLFTAKGTAALFAGWGAARLTELNASWTAVLWAALACDALAAALAYFALRPAVALSAPNGRSGIRPTS